MAPPVSQEGSTCGWSCGTRSKRANMPPVKMRDMPEERKHNMIALKQTVDAYDFHADPGPAEYRDGAVFVPATVSGSFPGSPIALTYRFGMDADRIASLEIA